MAPTANTSEQESVVPVSTAETDRGRLLLQAAPADKPYCSAIGDDAGEGAADETRTRPISADGLEGSPYPRGSNWMRISSISAGDSVECVRQCVPVPLPVEQVRDRVQQVTEELAGTPWAVTSTVTGPFAQLSRSTLSPSRLRFTGPNDRWRMLVDPPG